MLLRLVDVDGLRRVGSAPTGITPTGIALAAAAELACSVAAGRFVDDHRLYDSTEDWFRGIPFWSHALEWFLDGRRPPPAEMWAAPSVEMWPIHTEDDVAGLGWSQFQDRFRRSAVQRGFSSNLASALSMALAEMADNVFQHSDGARGLVAFHTVERCVHWCVADLGRGVLASLRTSSRWHSLERASDALTSVWRDHATSRPDAVTGSGFRQVERSLAALNGRLRFRSDDAVLELAGTTGGLRSTVRSSPPLVGLQIGASCAIGNEPTVSSL